MFKLDTPLRKIAIGALAAVTLAGSLVATTGTADAGWRHGYHRHGVGPGVAAGIIGGLALGALAARPYYAPRFASRCWVEPRRVVDRFGQVFWQQVRVCD